MNWNLNDLPLFIAVAETSSFSKAAVRLNIQKSSVSRAIARLEERLNVKLLERNNRYLRLTSDGAQLYQQLKPLLEQVNLAGDEFYQKGLAGELNIAVTLAFSREVMAPHLNDFVTRFPDIRLNMKSTTRILNLYEDKLDLAIQLGPLAPSGFYAQHLADIELCWMSSPAYLSANPELVNSSWLEIQKHVRYYHSQENYPANFCLFAPDGNEYPVTFPMANQLEDVLMVRDSVVAGAGISLLPDIYCRQLVKEKKLIRIAPEIKVSPNVTIYAVYASKKSSSPRLKTMLSFMNEITTNYLNDD
ncbi:LysR family transcriptional regulator [Moritella sp. 36]|uniref:LysR family transcriptional regulator n=1 Tax=Moritella sp. 36 TaxID=2746233 RepID=UPI001BA96FFE|nr:LysR family transcriptional regulator [Moritella sp. 36]QUM90042.1 LysR family transcriptional regulator [Moritella sp. 36]